MTDPRDSVRSLRIAELSVSLRSRSVLVDVTLEAPTGSITALLGNNGAGKTTLLRALCGLVEYRGQAVLDTSDGPIDLSRLDEQARARTLAYVPQRSQLDAALSVEEVVEMGCYAQSLRGLEATMRGNVERALEQADMSSLRTRSFTELSGGEQRRTLLARALATEARVLLLDEPTASLDLAHALSLFALLRRLANEGYLIVAALHRLADVLEHADYACVLDAGRVLASGTPKRVLDRDLLSRIFGLEMIEAGAPAFRRAALRPSAPGTGTERDR